MLETAIPQSDAIENAVFSRCVFPSPYLPVIIIPPDVPFSHAASSPSCTAFSICGLASAKYLPTALDGIPERSASMTRLASISLIRLPPHPSAVPRSPLEEFPWNHSSANHSAEQLPEYRLPHPAPTQLLSAPAPAHRCRPAGTL